VTPQLVLAFELEAQVGPPLKFAGAQGERRVIPILSGTFTGPDLRGVVVPGGADYQRVHADGFTEVEARYLLETDQGERIDVVNRGMRHAAPDVIAALNAGHAVDPAQVYFRTTPVFDTASPRLRWMVRSIFIATGQRAPAGVRIQCFRVL
jgi:hypothetical protein